MHSSSCLLPLLLLVAVASLGTAGAEDLPLIRRAGAPSMYTCSGTGKWNNTSPYWKNLADLRSTLLTPDPATVDNWWFRSRTVGTVPDQASGLAMCLADSDAQRCLKCLRTAIPLCSHSQGMSFVNTDGCIIRYKDRPFFGSVEPIHSERLISHSNAQPADVASMRQARGRLLSQLADMAGGHALRFATGSQGYVDTFTGLRHVMYGLAQCTRDLPLSECTSCLLDNFAVIYKDATNDTSTIVMGYSCYLRYQLNKPIDITGMAPTPSPAPSPAPTVLQ